MDFEKLTEMASDSTGRYSFVLLIQMLSMYRAMADDKIQILSEEAGRDLASHFDNFAEHIISDVASHLYESPEEMAEYIDSTSSMFDELDWDIIDRGASA